MNQKIFENNQVNITGEIVSDFCYSHEVFGEGFYMVDVSVSRLSGFVDVIPLMVSERLVDTENSHIGQYVNVSGQFRSYNRHAEKKNSLILSVFVREIEFVGKVSEVDDRNEIFLDGYLCKDVVYRKTPLKREIGDILLAVNRAYGKSDYVPGICWGRNARYVSGLPVGSHIQICGRIQSREYQKKFRKQKRKPEWLMKFRYQKLSVWRTGRMKIKLKSLRLENFKGIKEKLINFSERTGINGQNASGKTTVFDAFTWLLFNKNSAGEEKFNVRPLDSDGNRIDNVEIKVMAVLEVDGKEVELSKIQKQNWVKKRGTDTAVLQGNVNSFEIDGYPKSEAEFKAYISDLVAEDLFKMLTNPQYFANMKWKDQREILMKFVSSVSDVELAKENSEFADLLPELEKAPSTDDIQKKFQKALNEWKKKQAEIPVCIDELSKSMVSVDIAELELQRNNLKEQISEAEQKMDDAAKAYEDYGKKSDGILELKFKISDIEREAFSVIESQRREIQRKMDEAENGFNDSRQRIRMAELDIERLQSAISGNEAEKVRLQNEWKIEKAKAFAEYIELPELDENSLVCPTCGQELPEELKVQRTADYEQRKEQYRKDYDDSKELFEGEKLKRLAEIEKSGSAIVETIKKQKEELAKAEESLQQAKEESIASNKKKNVAMEELDALPVEPDLSANQEYEGLVQQLQKMEEALSQMNSGADYRSQLKIQIAGLREELSVAEKKIASADNSAIGERIGELESEQREVGQKVADQEKMLYLLEQFISFKLDKISEEINKHFKYVSFRLFKEQYNGGIVPTCEIKYVKDSRGDLNNGHKIVAGLDIINSLSELYGVYAPIWIDNAESVNEFNLPDMDTQLILLSVTEDKELKVEGV